MPRIEVRLFEGARRGSTLYAVSRKSLSGGLLRIDAPAFERYSASLVDVDAKDEIEGRRLAKPNNSFERHFQMTNDSRLEEAESKVEQVPFRISIP